MECVLARLCMALWHKLYTVPQNSLQIFLAFTNSLGIPSGFLVEIGFLRDGHGTAEKHKTNRCAALGASREALTLENGGRVISAVEIMADAVNAGDRDLLSRFEDLLSLRCTLHLSPRKNRSAA